MRKRIKRMSEREGVRGEGLLNLRTVVAILMSPGLGCLKSLATVAELM